MEKNKESWGRRFYRGTIGDISFEPALNMLKGGEPYPGNKFIFSGARGVKHGLCLTQDMVAARHYAQNVEINPSRALVMEVVLNPDTLFLDISEEVLKGHDKSAKQKLEDYCRDRGVGFSAVKEELETLESFDFPILIHRDYGLYNPEKRLGLCTLHSNQAIQSINYFSPVPDDYTNRKGRDVEDAKLVTLVAVPLIREMIDGLNGKIRPEVCENKVVQKEGTFLEELDEVFIHRALDDEPILGSVRKYEFKLPPDLAAIRRSPFECRYYAPCVDNESALVRVMPAAVESWNEPVDGSEVGRDVISEISERRFYYSYERVELKQ
ncbi:hypothetical protein GV64_23120 [Endozoicomonas elysicola]|uniref:Uncharacterized protein n=2 Tax=Endozoicomonas elysicola TaxID=305900 RepID=A0A081KGE5_9GAMM|nr:hypothetical protein GV64_23120 [Endozoicomonas elysicola]